MLGEVTGGSFAGKRPYYTRHDGSSVPEVLMKRRMGHEGKGDRAGAGGAAGAGADGLASGEKVIISGYELFGDNEKLILNE